MDISDTACMAEQWFSEKMLLKSPSAVKSIQHVLVDEVRYLPIYQSIPSC